MGVPTLQRWAAVSDVGCAENEDLGNRSGRAAWVLDGATGVTGTNYTPGRTDGQWYVETFDECLRSAVDDWSSDLPTVVEDAIDRTRTRFEEHVSREDIDAAAEPSATAAIVRWRTGTLEYFVLCDSTFVLYRDGSVVKQLTDDRIERIEDDVLGEVEQLVTDEGMGLERARQRVMSELRSNRRMKNDENGYWVLGFEPEAAGHALHGRIPVEPDDVVYLFTDGFARLVTTYEVFPDWSAALDDVAETGLEQVIDRMRAIEADDPDGRRHPRTKRADDATVVRLRFE